MFGVSLGNHGLTLLLIPAVGLFVLAVDRGILRRPASSLAALARLLRRRGRCCTSSCRSAPASCRAPLVYGHPETWSGFWDVVLARQFQGAVTGR